MRVTGTASGVCSRSEVAGVTLAGGGTMGGGVTGVGAAGVVSLMDAARATLTRTTRRPRLVQARISTRSIPARQTSTKASSSGWGRNASWFGVGPCPSKFITAGVAQSRISSCSIDQRASPSTTPPTTAPTHRLGSNVPASGGRNLGVSSMSVSCTT